MHMNNLHIYIGANLSVVDYFDRYLEFVLRSMADNLVKCRKLEDFYQIATDKITSLCPWDKS